MIQVSNQKPIVLDDAYSGNIGIPFDPYDAVRDTFVKPMFNPLIPSAQVTIDNNGTLLTEDDIVSSIFNCSKDVIDPKSESLMKSIFKQTLQYYTDNDLLVQDVFAVQAGIMEGMPLASAVPGRMVTYRTIDVRDAAKALLADQISPRNFFANVAFTMQVNTFGFYFANDAAWSDFKTWFSKNIVQPIAASLPPDTVKLCTSIQSIKLNKLTESFAIRNDDTCNNEDFSFARLFHMGLMSYEKYIQSQKMPAYTAGHMPFSLAETICPRTIVIINVEKHAHAQPSEIKKEWEILKRALSIRPKLLGQNQIANLMASARQLNAISGFSTNGPGLQAAKIKLKKTPPTDVDIFKYIERIYKHAQYVQTSENEIKYTKRTYNRASRRHPDNPDIMGKAVGKVYKPDLMVFLDGSGSVSEAMYQDGMKAVIKLAKKMGVNLYFSSFSDTLAMPVKLHVKGKTVNQIYKEFQSIKKVTGGTDYEQIWHFINKSETLRKRVSIIISDFEYTAPNHHVLHPRFLYYAPVTNTNWNRITNSATYFIRSMLHICPDIRKHVLM